MIGSLPTTVEIGRKTYNIRTDYRDCLRILEAYADAELNADEKTYAMLCILYKDFNCMPREHYKEAVEKGIWFLNCGDTIKEAKLNEKPIYDWQQDEQLIFSAVNKVAGREVRECKYMHFWTFISYFYEIGEGLFSTVVNIRSKKNKGKKLEKYEQEFYRNNRQMIDLKRKYSIEQQEEIDRINRILG